MVVWGQKRRGGMVNWRYERKWKLDENGIDMKAVRTKKSSLLSNLNGWKSLWPTEYNAMH